MKTKLRKRVLAFLLIAAMVLPLASCGGVENEAIQAENLMEGIQENPKEQASDESIPTCGEGVPNNPEDAVTNFSIELFKNALEADKNTLISPLSVMIALSMTGNGAKGETLKQMETVFDTHISILNGYFAEYMDALPQGEKYKLKLANSIWFTADERFTVEQDFLQKNADYYDADIYRTDFEKDTALKDINLWVEEETDGMVKDILGDIPQDIIMCLINALAFEAEWEETYDKNQVHEKIFTTEAGKEQKVDLMYSHEFLYLEDEAATGFVKYYEDEKYAFVALLPNEGISVSDYVAGLSGEQIKSLLANPRNVHVNAAIPVFNTEYDLLMNDVLMEMGISDAFYQDLADFTGLGTSTGGNIFISRVLHKTYITVGPQGTKAGAATVVEAVDSAAPIYEDSKTVYLDRPFVYMLIDCENNQPFFIGTVMTVED